jgi:hypothetical protein
MIRSHNQITCKSKGQFWSFMWSTPRNYRPLFCTHFTLIIIFINFASGDTLSAIKCQFESLISLNAIWPVHTPHSQNWNSTPLRKINKNTKLKFYNFILWLAGKIWVNYPRGDFFQPIPRSLRIKMNCVFKSNKKLN